MLFTIFIFLFLSQVLATAVHARTNVVGSVGELNLNLTGYISPFASVVLSSDKVFMRSTVSDEKGNFSFTDVLIKKGFSGFCLTAVDFHRIGDSETCFSFPPAKESVTKDNIFLPPTLALSRNAIGPNESADAFGYTMPGARVTLVLSNGTTLGVNADGTGYYIFKIKNLPPGKYELYATAVYKDKDSEAPSSKKTLESYSAVGKVTTDLTNLLKKLLTGLFNLLLTYIWILFPLFILLIILLAKPLKEKLKPFLHKINPSKEYSAKPDFHHLHHYWFIGY